MIRKAPIATVSQKLPELLEEIRTWHDSIVITEGDEPVAALVDVALFEKLRSLDDQFDQMLAELAQTYREADAETAEAEIAEAITAVRRAQDSASLHC